MCVRPLQPHQKLPNDTKEQQLGFPRLGQAFRTQHSASLRGDNWRLTELCFHARRPRQWMPHHHLQRMAAFFIFISSLFLVRPVQRYPPPSPPYPRLVDRISTCSLLPAGGFSWVGGDGGGTLRQGAFAPDHNGGVNSFFLFFFSRRPHTNLTISPFIIIIFCRGFYLSVAHGSNFMLHTAT